MTNQFTIINDLPQFKGNPRPHEKDSFVPGVNVKTFLRALENHFLQYNITDDDAKLRLLFTQIDKTSGDASDLVNCYVGRDVPYANVEAEFLSMYPNFSRSDFKCSARNIMASDITSPNLFSGMTRLETQARAVIEAYLSAPHMSTVPLSMNTQVIVTEGVDENGDELIRTMPCADVLQNFCMHLYMASQLNDQVYDKIHTTTPATSSTAFMAKAVQTAERERQLKVDGRRPNESNATNAVLYQMQHKGEKKTPQNTAPKNCFSCGKSGHFQRECRSQQKCIYCKASGHMAIKCYKRIKDRVAICVNCNRLGHDTKQCRSKSASDTLKKCSNCNKVGHESANCWSRGGKANPHTATASGYRQQKTFKPQRVHTLEEMEDVEDPNRYYEDDTDDRNE